MTEPARRHPHRRVRPGSLVVGLGAAALTMVIGFAVIDTPPGANGAAALLRERLNESGVSNPVTAVLLNFRAFDTLLEITVLVMALVACWALGQPAQRKPSSAGPVLEKAMRWFGPSMVLIAGYLLWRGATAPGGAFQAGAVLGTVGVLYLVIGRFPLAPGPWLRAAIVCGILVFLGAGLAFTAMTGGFLTYPPGQAKSWILAIEAACTLSIGVILAALFIGGRPSKDDAP